MFGLSVSINDSYALYSYSLDGGTYLAAGLIASKLFFTLRSSPVRIDHNDRCNLLIIQAQRSVTGQRGVPAG